MHRNSNSDAAEQERANVPSSPLILIIATSFLWIADAHEANRQASAPEVLHAEHDRLSRYDAGTLRVFVRNTSTRTITSLSVRQRVRDNVGRRAQPRVILLWQLLSPPAIKPGRVGEIVAKLKDPALRESADFDLVGDGLPKKIVSVSFEPKEIRIIAVRFAPTMSDALVYVANRSQEARRIRLLNVQGSRSKSTKCTLNNPVPAGDVGLVRCKLETAVSPGQYVHFAVESPGPGEKVEAHALVRAYSQFPIASFWGPSPAGDCHLDALPRLSFRPEARPAGYVAGLLAAPSRYAPTVDGAAQTFCQARTKLYAERPDLLAAIHASRIGAPESYYSLAPLADVVRVNTSLHLYWGLGPAAPEDYRESCHPFYWRSRHAWLACSPKPYHAAVYVGKARVDYGGSSILPEETRLMAYCALSAGSQGIYYRGSPPTPDMPANWSKFRRLNAELQALKPNLRLGCPVAWADSDSDRISAKALLCGDGALVIALLDCRWLPGNASGPYPRTLWPSIVKNRLVVTVRLPSGLAPERVRNLYEILPESSWQFRDGKLTVNVSCVQSGHALIVDLVSASSLPKEERNAVDPRYVPSKARIDLWRTLSQKYGETRLFRQIHSRLRTVTRVRRALEAGVEGISRSVRMEIGPPPIAGLEGAARKEAGDLLPVPSAAFLFLTYADFFKDEFASDDASGPDRQALVDLYNLEFERQEAAVRRAVEPALIISREDPGVLAWPLVLPLLRAGRAGPVDWGNLLDGMRLSPPESFALAEYCLADMGHASAFMQISKWRAQRKGVSFDPLRHCVTTALQMAAKGRAEAGWRLLGDVAARLKHGSEPQGTLRLHMVDIALKAGRQDLAEKECAALQTDFAGTKVAREALFRHVKCLAMKGDFQSVLERVEPLLNAAAHREYRTDLLYLKWSALVRTRQNGRAYQVAHELLLEQPDAERASTVLMWIGTQALELGNYDAAHQAFSRVVAKDPSGKRAATARAILARIKNLRGTQ